MLLEYNGRSGLWGALFGLLLFGSLWISTFKQEIQFAKYLFGILSILCAATIYFIWESNDQVSKLLNILVEKRKEVSEGEVFFNGIRLYPDTQVIQFKIVISIIFWSYMIHSKPHAFRGKKPEAAAFAYSLLCLLLGIWSRKGLTLAPISFVENQKYSGATTIGNLCNQIELWGKPVKIN